MYQTTPFPSTCIVLKTEIQAANARFMAEFAAQSAEGIGALYTTDCKVMPTGADVMMGRDGE